jgi:hypothetical protein
MPVIQENPAASVRFFSSHHGLCLFDPDTYKIFMYHNGSWVESIDPDFRETIRFGSVELSRQEALNILA